MSEEGSGKREALACEFIILAENARAFVKYRAMESRMRMNSQDEDVYGQAMPWKYFVEVRIRRVGMLKIRMVDDNNSRREVLGKVVWTTVLDQEPI